MGSPHSREAGAPERQTKLGTKGMQVPRLKNEMNVRRSQARDCHVFAGVSLEPMRASVKLPKTDNLLIADPLIVDEDHLTQHLRCDPTLEFGF